MNSWRPTSGCLLQLAVDSSMQQADRALQDLKGALTNSRMAVCCITG
jgi:hypothetical protein